MRLAALALVLVACGGNGGDSPVLDARHGGDARGSGSGSADAAPDGAHAAYSHTILIDGTNDFSAGETFQTTSAPTFTAYLTWDATNIYVGYSGPDLARTAPDASTKWLFMFVDVDPGASTGAAMTPLYHTQQATLPTGFGAEYYLRFKSDGTFASLEHYDGSAWSTQSAAPTSANLGTYTEAAFPRALLTGETAGVVTYMIDEKPGGEASFAGLYVDSFTDGYATDLPITRYLKIDFTSAASPNDPGNRAPPP